MNFDDFGFAGDDGDYDLPDGREHASYDDRYSVDSLDTEALERWLEANHGLWELGLQLAIQARQYRREFRHMPFNQTGWYSPN